MSSGSGSGGGNNGWGGSTGSLTGDIAALSSGKGVPGSSSGELGGGEVSYGESELPPIPGWSDITPEADDEGEEKEESEDLDADGNPVSDEEADGEPKAAAGKDKGTGNRKRIPVDKGRSFVDVDYSDKKAIDQAFLMAHGARKWQTERDQAKKQAESLRTEHDRLKKDWTGLDEAWSRGGIAGLVDMLEGKQGAFQEYVTKKMERERFLAGAEPHEKDAFLSKEREAERVKEVERIRKENADFRQSVEKEREEAQVAALRGQVNPAFEKYRFAGTLGDEQAEHTFDSMMWNEALRRLEPYEEQGVELTPEMINRTFKEISSTLRRRMANQADRQTKKAVETKKREAAESVQTRVSSGYKKSSTAEQEALALMDNGNLGAVFRGWGKYKGIFGGK